MKKSAYLDRVKELRRAAQEATRKTFTQYLTDTACIALNDMGWGKDRIDKFLDLWGAAYDKFFDALRNEPETDYCRVKLDERCKLICKTEFKPFDERYQFLQEVRYDKG